MAAPQDPADRDRTRLNPPRTHGRYFGLVRLRQAIEAAVADYVAPMPAPRVVDLGCGTMPYRALFEPHVTSYTGADLPSNPDADHAMDARTGRVDLPDACADAVLSTQVLEHVESPEAYLAEAHRLCRPGGLLILSTHGLFKHHPDPQDYWRWTGSGLDKLLSRNGWRVERRAGVLGFGAAAWGLMQDAIVTRLPRVRWVRASAAACLQQGVGVLDRLYTDEQRRENAAVFVAVARKPETERLAA